MDDKINEGLALCYKTAKILKEKFPNDIMKIQKNTIIPFTSNKRLCDNTSLGGSYAHYHNSKPHRICVKQKFLKERMCWSTKINNRKDRHKIYGNFAIAELITHELSHHRTSGHGKGFKIKYKKLWNYIVNQFINGEYYNTNSLYNV